MADKKMASLNLRAFRNKIKRKSITKQNKVGETTRQSLNKRGESINGMTIMNLGKDSEIPQDMEESISINSASE